MATRTAAVVEVCAAARTASLAIARSSTATRNRALEALAEGLLEGKSDVLSANALDLERGIEAEISPALLDRLRLTEAHIAAIAADVRAIAALPDPVGETIEGHRLANGLDVRKVRVPLGVVAVVYEARPNVTIDCSALCIKSGNAIVLRGSTIAAESNAALAAIASAAVEVSGLPGATVSLIAGGGREELGELATQSDTVDLIIPRGGEGLKTALKQYATVPVIYASAGNCHVFVDASADLGNAVEIIVNAKIQRPGVCNSAETLLVHADVASDFLPLALHALREAGVELRVDERARAASGALAGSLNQATEEDWATEFLALVLAVKVVDSPNEAIEHINRYGSGHSEAVVTGSVATAQAFSAGVDAACVYVNASTRFSDGGVFGMGAEIGNSTQKLHARGPIGLRELCTYKYVIEGSGQVRA